MGRSVERPEQNKINHWGGSSILVRAPACHAGGCEFKPRLSRDKALSLREGFSFVFSVILSNAKDPVTAPPSSHTSLSPRTCGASATPFGSTMPKCKHFVAALASYVFAGPPYTVSHCIKAMPALGPARQTQYTTAHFHRHPEERSDEGSSYRTLPRHLEARRAERSSQCSPQDVTGCFEASPLNMTHTTTVTPPCVVILSAAKNPVTVPLTLSSRTPFRDHLTQFPSSPKKFHFFCEKHAFSVDNNMNICIFGSLT